MDSNDKRVRSKKLKKAVDKANKDFKRSGGDLGKKFHSSEDIAKWHSFYRNRRKDLG